MWVEREADGMGGFEAKSHKIKGLRLCHKHLPDFTRKLVLLKAN